MNKQSNRPAVHNGRSPTHVTDKAELAVDAVQIRSGKKCFSVDAAKLASSDTNEGEKYLAALAKMVNGMAEIVVDARHLAAISDPRQRGVLMDLLAQLQSRASQFEVVAHVDEHGVEHRRPSLVEALAMMLAVHGTITARANVRQAAVHAVAMLPADQRELGVATVSEALKRIGLNAAARRAFAKDVEQLAKNLRPKPETEQLSAAGLLQLLKIDVLGEREDRSIIIWSNERRTRIHLPPLANWREQDILTFGPTAKIKLFRERDDPPPGQITFDQVRDAVADLINQLPRMRDDQQLGQGVWLHKDQILIVNGGWAGIYDGVTITGQTSPRLGDRIIDFDAGRRWGNGLSKRIRATDQDAATVILHQLEKLAGNWNWLCPSDALLFASLMCAVCVQSVWDWRPLVAVLGASDTGKSTLIDELVLPLFGRTWALRSDSTTAAGVRQRILHHSPPIIFDEFDANRHRERILEMFRNASRGGIARTGSVDQRGHEFLIQHLAMFFGIELGAQRMPDVNRFIRLELSPPCNRGKLELPDKAHLTELGQQMFAAAIWSAQAARQLAIDIRAMKFAGVHGRLVESFAVPAAMAAVLGHGRGATEQQAARLLRQFISEHRPHFDVPEADERRLLRDILGANFRYDSPSGSVTKSVADALLIGSGRQAVERAGVKIVNSDNEMFLFIDQNRARRQLLAGTQWEHMVIADILLRSDKKAKRGQHTCAGVRTHGVLVPMSLVREEVSRLPLVAADIPGDDDTPTAADDHVGPALPSSLTTSGSQKRRNV